jgi:diketogulonate reductase-like aldo/keto reductase
MRPPTRVFRRSKQGGTAGRRLIDVILDQSSLKSNCHDREIAVTDETVISESDARVLADGARMPPFEYRRRLLEACRQRDVALEAYSPLGTGRHLNDPVVTEIAQRLDRTPAQVLIRWCLQRDAVVIPKSTHRERIEQNAHVFDVSLPDEDLQALDRLDRTGGTDEARESKWW